MIAIGDGMDWLLRPTLRGMLSYESLTNGTVSICDVALLNDALDVADQNTATARTPPKGAPRRG